MHPVSLPGFPWPGLPGPSQPFGRSNRPRFFSARGVRDRLRSVAFGQAALEPWQLGGYNYKIDYNYI